MKTYAVEYMSRIRGSIGVSTGQTVHVNASDVTEARNKAFQKLQKEGFETFHVVSVRLIT